MNTAISNSDDRDADFAPAIPLDQQHAETDGVSEPDGFYRGSFFGRRKGHKLRLHQADLFGTLLPRLALDIAGAAPDDLRTLFDPAVDAVRVEIGFGGGEHLVAEALAFPHIGFIGCEPYLNGMAKILTLIEAHGLGNVRLYAGDAAELLTWAPPRSLTRIDLIHPDPWPKRRHWKRRFVQDATLAAMARVLVPDGEFRFVHDIPDYVAWTLWHLARSPDFAWTAERAADWSRPWPDYTMTRYGRKAEREGRKAAYLISRKVSEAL
ncbi:tRNA (guanine(46)-N(7))-methyltransferase TrmB [Tardiphaga sp.]|uniref:tRNA (guanine(46)-N(7))-methyltransferase TrmB n=1 Tax=Tardiphaga sp. TaxID=1926292 RepID=UPI0019C95774|nr:tRNA (guanine(46)-N(7))-methyltransferase TrmB [Tardiphaga sp.]MBC7579786.1 tRNA (guanosine(46)-N7)-methyltransferase TrmB [Tardiphaga sp.]